MLEWILKSWYDVGSCRMVLSERFVGRERSKTGISAATSTSSSGDGSSDCEAAKGTVHRFYAGDFLHADDRH